MTNTSPQPELIRCPNCLATIPNPKHHDPFINTLANISTGIIAWALLTGVIVGTAALIKWALYSAGASGLGATAAALIKWALS